MLFGNRFRDHAPRGTRGHYEFAEHDRFCASCRRARRHVDCLGSQVGQRQERRGQAAAAARLRAAGAGRPADGAKALCARQFPGDADRRPRRRRAGAAHRQRGLSEGSGRAGQAAAGTVRRRPGDGRRAACAARRARHSRNRGNRRSPHRARYGDTVGAGGCAGRAGTGPAGRRRGASFVAVRSHRCHRGADAAGRGRSVARAGGHP